MDVHKKLELLQYSGDKNTQFKLIVSPDLEIKIRTFCALSPDREWSGVLFYLFEGDFKNGVTIYANDMYLMDQGSGVHTEFDLDAPEITRYMIVEGLTNHCMGLIHSHNQMQAFFSGEDRSTLIDHGEHMYNFVSLVVNNEGKYVARLTRQATFEGVKEIKVLGKLSSPLFNTGKTEETEYNSVDNIKLKSSFIEYVDLDITRDTSNIPQFNQILERFGEVSSKCSRQAEKVNFGYGREYPVYTPKVKVDTEVQGTLFKEDKVSKQEVENTIDIPLEVRKELETIPWNDIGYDKFISQLLFGSPFSRSITLDKPTISNINKLYKERFPKEKDFAYWFDYWLDFLLSDFDVPLSDDSEFTDSEEVLLYKTYTFLCNKNLVYKNTILKTLTGRLLL